MAFQKTPYEKTYAFSNVASVDDVFNVGIGYVTLKVLKPFAELDIYETIAMYGTESINDYSIPEILIPKRRVEALTRLAFTIKLLISNCVFVFISRRDLVSKAIMYDLKLKTEELEKLIPNAFSLRRNPITNTMQYSINERYFVQLLDKFRDIKEQLSAPINKAGLIFRQRPNDNPESLVDDFVRRG